MIKTYNGKKNNNKQACKNDKAATLHMQGQSSTSYRR